MWKLPAFPPAIVAAALVVLSTGAPARASSSEWVEANNVRARLVALNTDTQSGPNAAIEIEMASGWKTYWRSPGDAGVPPMFDFSGSSNLKSATVGFPPPVREDDGFTVSNVYSGRVVLPLTVEAVDPSKAVDLSLKFDLGVCEEICIPATLETGVVIEPGGSDSEAAALLSEAVATLPQPPEAGKFDVDGLKRAGGDDNEPVFEFQAHVPDPANTQIFVEGPSDWYSDTPRPVQGTSESPATWRFTFDRLGAKTPIAKAPIRFTVVSGGRAIEEIVTLD